MHACVLYGGRLVVVDLLVAEREPRCARSERASSGRGVVGLRVLRRVETCVRDACVWSVRVPRARASSDLGRGIETGFVI